MAVPLSQLAALNPDESTNDAIGDWHYWVSQGYPFQKSSPPEHVYAALPKGHVATTLFAPRPAKRIRP
jgi:hypothetical protein